MIFNGLDIDRLHYVVENYPVGRSGGNTTAKIEEFIGCLFLGISNDYVMLIERYNHLNYLPRMVMDRLKAHNIDYFPQSRTRIMVGPLRNTILDFVVKEGFYERNMYGRRCHVIEVDY